MPTWPLTLPTAPLYDGYAETQPANYVEFQPSVGAPIRRRRSTAITRPFTVQFMVTGSQAEDLVEFYRDDCAGGSLSFDGLTNPRTGSALTFMFSSDLELTDPIPNAGDGGYRATFRLLELP